MQREVDQRHEGVATLLLPALKGGAPVAPPISVEGMTAAPTAAPVPR